MFKHDFLYIRAANLDKSKRKNESIQCPTYLIPSLIF